MTNFQFYVIALPLWAILITRASDGWPKQATAAVLLILIIGAIERCISWCIDTYDKYRK